MMPKILIVDDEPAMVSGLKDNFEFEGYSVDTAFNGLDALNKLSKNEYSVCILDVMMPAMNGFDVCKKVRELKIHTPILLLTAKGQEIDKVLGLELGADDYLTKPFGLRELLARVKALLRRSQLSSENKPVDSTMTIGKLTFDFAKYSVTEKDEVVHMSAKEIEIIHYMVKHKNETLSRDDLLTHVWGYDEQISSRTVDNFMVKLRHKIEPQPEKPIYIITVHGIGYRLILKAEQ